MVFTIEETFISDLLPSPGGNSSRLFLSDP